MTAAELLAALQGKGATITENAGKLRVEAPKGILSEGDWYQLRQQRDALLELVTSRITPRPLDWKNRFTKEEILAMSPQEFSASGIAVKIDSSVLGETIILASNEVAAAQVKDVGLTVYVPAEIEELRDSSPSTLRAVHAAKKQFHGTVVPIPKEAFNGSA